MNSIFSLFDRITPIYDQMNKIMSFGKDKYWRKKLLSYVPWKKHKTLCVLDVACGTGAISEILLKEAENYNQACCCWMLDPSSEMLAYARTRCYTLMPFFEMHFLKGYAEAIPLPSRCAHVYICGFGLRNVQNRSFALQEAFRILVPNGVLLILEFSFEVLPSLAWAYRCYLMHGIPLIGKWIGKDQQAYQYLSDSILKFPSPHVILKECFQTGFEKIFYTTLQAGLVQLYYAQKPYDSLHI
ncbi:ubiquinone/menaquinone biosynthesis C-methyltransferase UbiE [Holospora obtusa F1]|uniref:Ubiquinone/menaquinone biosynthesis C-methyltransferase UbiE n=1 Tax=Holospora obtusa F1 TaxID=1399147 RepID=W6TE54_HOLOB|nr:ubiquinone/menaquinone biosynthesis methyltransferase [Holospora obtusa]ETZ07418.1 ubiquinone/menaquinone biosynthesis C-methyltransferase UbiE [Holospora obtusa F1]